MSGKLDQSLDEILSTNKGTRAGGRRSTRKTARPAAAAPVGGVKKNTKPARGAAAKPSTGKAAKPPGESKIIVSNLVRTYPLAVSNGPTADIRPQPKDVSESQIKVCYR
jgi:THO complex subunit 4